MIDRATRWFGAYPVADKSADEAFRCLSHFAGPRDVVQSFYSDNSPELKRAALELRWPHPTSTPGRPDRNGVAERNVRVATEGARALLMHAGLPENWWPQAMAYMSVARNIESIEGLSPWESRFGGNKFQGPKIPFGALVDFKPSPVRGGPPKFAPKAVPGIFLGWVLLPGGKWKGDFLAAQLSDFTGEEADWRTVAIHRMREVVPPSGKDWEFPLKAGYDLRRRTLQSPPSSGPMPSASEPVADDPLEPSLV